MFSPPKQFTALILIALAGCTTVPRPHPNAERPPDVDLTERPSSPALTPEAQLTPRTGAPRPVLSPTFTVPSEMWIHLGRWAQTNHVGSLTRQSGSTSPMFELTTADGNFMLRTGSELARWAGLEVRLGFAPQLIGEEPFLHRLDLQKNLIPLLTNPRGLNPGLRVIVLDPGHGGRDSGTRSAGGDLEKDYTLDWAQRLQVLLEAAGWQVYLTRTNDVAVSLTDRVAIADQHRADLFLSLHFNATASPEHAGIETYCITPTGMPSNVTRGYEDNVSLAFPNNQFDAQNLQLALKLHRKVLGATGANDRGVRRARFITVLRGQNRPAALIEGGYLSNPDEAALIATADHRQKLADAVAKALQQP